MDIEFKENIVDVVECVECGEYEDEYVYDIEMDDESHTFVCNDVLVHNSAYLTLQPVIEACGISADLATHFILSFNDNVLADYLDGRFEDYAKAYNCKKNLESFELEKIARSVLMQKKKKYVMDIAWKEPDVFLPPLKQLVFKGVEVTKGESSIFVRNEQREFVKWIMSNINEGKKLRYPEIVARLRQIKERFIMAPPDDICKTVSMSDYEKYILNDKGNIVDYCEDVPSIPYHAKASSWYNNMLYTTAAKYRSRYPLIKKGDKVRVYNVKDPVDEEHETFAFLPGNFPREFAPPIDMDTQFEKMILDPLNRYVEALGYQPIGAKLTYKSKLY